MAEQSICTIPDCSKPVRGYTCLCNAHRIRLWRHGNAEAGGRMQGIGTVEERFWAFVDKSDGCWLWNGSRNNKGYGDIAAGSGKHMLAHRVSWQIHFGELPHKIGVLHRCDTPACVNPNHLFLGTQKVNMIDCKTKGRTIFGEKNPMAKLTEPQVIEIIRLVKAGFSHAVVAHQFEVSTSTVSLIAAKRRWAHIA